MKLDVTFKDNDKTIPVGFESSDNGFYAYFGDVQQVSGPPGKSAYEVAQENGFEGTEEEWLESLKGEPGKTPEKGVDYFDGADGCSPSVAVSDIDGGHRVTITDKDGEKAFDVMDGKDGENAEGGGTVHWDDVEGKPVVSVGGSDTLTWDGNTEGLTVVHSLVAPELFWAKVSDEVFTDEQIKAMSFFFTAIGETLFVYNNESDTKHWDAAVIRGGVTEDFVVMLDPSDPFVVFIRKAGVTFGDAEALSGVTFNEPGVYFFYAAEGVYNSALTFPNSACFNAQEKIAPSHLYQPDWEQMDETAPDFVKNKPFGEMPTGGDTLYWDGNTEGLLEVVGTLNTANKWYKVSDVVLTEEDVLCENDFYDTMVVLDTSSNQFSFNENSALLAMMDDTAMVGSDGERGYDPSAFFGITEYAICTVADNVEVFGTIFPEKGIYFTPDVRYLYLLNCTKFPSTKLMDKKYLPMSDITAAVLSALPIYNGEVEEV